MVRILILIVVGLLSFSIVFGLGYLFIVPHTPQMEMEEGQSPNDMTPATDNMMKSDAEEGTEEPPPPPPKTK